MLPIDSTYPEQTMHGLVGVVGVATIVLGIWHLGVPVWFHVRTAVHRNGATPLPPVRLVPLRYGTSMRDVLGVVWIMNLAASYGLTTIGIALVATGAWVGTPVGRIVALWIAGWWFVRAAAQLALGRRWADVVAMAVCGSLGVLALVLAIE